MMRTIEEVATHKPKVAVMNEKWNHWNNFRKGSNSRFVNNECDITWFDPFTVDNKFTRREFFCLSKRNLIGINVRQ